MIKRFCDRCGSEIKGNLWYTNVHLEFNKSTANFVFSGSWSDKPLMCVDCFETVEARVDDLIKHATS